MRVLLQLIKGCSLSIDGQPHSSCGRGFCLFVGFEEGDGPDVVGRMARKIARLRVFPDSNGKTNLSLKDVGGEIMSVSQFTLYADAREGNRPSFVRAMRPERAKPLYELFNTRLAEETGAKIAAGVFGADMQVSLINDGPFTLWLDSKELFS
jgi:D-tyrosyl-tRNA(Tyr) deacylase